VQCNYWGNTVILVTWDDWGGFYDDVLPWRCDNKGNCLGYFNSTGQQFVYGFRVPLLVVSAWTPQGYVSARLARGARVNPTSTTSAAA
jgi:phospholipase C